VQRDRLQLLIAEDNASDRLILEALVRRLGHEALLAVDGEQAIQLFIEKKPDMVLLDVMMPVLDGIDTARRMRELAGKELVPIIFLTSLHDAKDLAACLDAGGDDFLSKPYNPVILKAKLNAFTRMRRLHTEVSAQREFLLQEQRMAKSIFDNIVHHGALNAPNIRYQISPMSVFNGDVLVAAQQPTGDILVLLGDFTGHGLPAAIGTLPLSEIFHGMAMKGFALEYIMREINSKLKNVLPLGVFCCATAVSLNFRNRCIEAWAGGLPAGAIFNRRTGQLREITSTHLPLGILSAQEFKYEPCLFDMDKDDLIYLWSDGLLETASPDGELFGEQRLREVFARSRDKVMFEELLRAVGDFSEDSEQLDDHTLIEIGMLSDEIILEKDSRDRKLIRSGQGPQHWRFQYELRGDSLRQFDPIPVLTHVFLQAPGLRQHSGKVNTILAELYSNALEHGILGLSSEIKQDSDGFSRYYQMRSERLQALQEGSIIIGADHKPTEEGGLLRLCVKDSGPGFDFTLPPDHTGRPRFYGRGMILVSSLCQNVAYKEPGNEVMVEFVWSNS
jgi:CheY-like chemotaxis protein